MTHRFGRVPLAAEVDALKAEIGGDDQVVAGRRSEHGAVVTDSGDERTT